MSLAFKTGLYPEGPSRDSLWHERFADWGSEGYPSSIKVWTFQGQVNRCGSEGGRGAAPPNFEAQIFLIAATPS